MMTECLLRVSFLIQKLRLQSEVLVSHLSDCLQITEDEMSSIEKCVGTLKRLCSFRERSLEQMRSAMIKSFNDESCAPSDVSVKAEQLSRAMTPNRPALNSRLQSLVNTAHQITAALNLLWLTHALHSQNSALAIRKDSAPTLFDFLTEERFKDHNDRKRVERIYDYSFKMLQLGVKSFFSLSGRFSHEKQFKNAAKEMLSKTRDLLGRPLELRDGKPVTDVPGSVETDQLWEILKKGFLAVSDAQQGQFSNALRALKDDRQRVHRISVNLGRCAEDWREEARGSLDARDLLFKEDLAKALERKMDSKRVPRKYSVLTDTFLSCLEGLKETYSLLQEGKVRSNYSSRLRRIAENLFNQQIDLEALGVPLQTRIEDKFYVLPDSLRMCSVSLSREERTRLKPFFLWQKQGGCEVCVTRLLVSISNGTQTFTTETRDELFYKDSSLPVEMDFQKSDNVKLEPSGAPVFCELFLRGPGEISEVLLETIKLDVSRLRCGSNEVRSDTRPGIVLKVNLVRRFSAKLEAQNLPRYLDIPNFLANLEDAVKDLKEATPDEKIPEPPESSPVQPKGHFVDTLHPTEVRLLDLMDCADLFSGRNVLDSASDLAEALQPLSRPCGNSGGLPVVRFALRGDLQFQLRRARTFRADLENAWKAFNSSTAQGTGLGPISSVTNALRELSEPGGVLEGLLRTVTQCEELLRETDKTSRVLQGLSIM